MTSPQNTASSRAVAPVIPSQDIPMTGAPIPAAGLSRTSLSASQAGVIAPVESAVSVPKHCEATTPASGGVGGFFDIRRKLAAALARKEAGDRSHKLAQRIYDLRHALLAAELREGLCNG